MTSSTAREVEGPPPGCAITRVGEQRWASFHIFCSSDRDALLLQVVEPVMSGLWTDRLVDRFFFIRYPEGGDHVRLRLRIAAGVGAEAAADGAFARLRASCAAFRDTLSGAAHEPITVVPAIFEPEIDRYGGPQRLPAALSFFALSSMTALRFVARSRRQPRARQLIEILMLLTRQAIGMARTAGELRGLADYVAEWRPRMAPILARADQVFDTRGPELTQQIRALFTAARTAGAGTPGGPDDLLVHGRSLAAAIDGLDPEPRWGALGSQMHMTANRLGLHTTEESYLSGILCRCLDALGDDLVDLVAEAQGDAPAEGLDAQVSAGMHALFAEGSS